LIYLDHHAATPLAPSVADASARAHEHAWANPASVHAAGRAARSLVEQTRRTLGEQLGAAPNDFVFTSGGTEACNLAVLGLAGRARHVIASALEHPAVLAPLRALTARGAELELLPLEAAEPPSPESLARALRDDTAVVALQWVNHETGAIAPVAEYAKICRARAVPLLVDASQAIGKLDCDLSRLDASAVVITASKIGGPTGAAALWVERGRELAPTLHGGAQERGRRAGTPDVAALAGFGAALAQLPDRLASMAQIGARRDQLERACVELGGVVNRSRARVNTVTNLSLRGWRGDVLVAALDVEGLCASSGAACSSGLGAPSPVLQALYPDEPWRAESALRLSLGPETSEDEVAAAIAALRRVLARRA
jgi:cysteine desulfurase